MDTREILKGLKAERKRLDRVIALLSGGGLSASVVKRSTGKRNMSAAEKARRSKAAKDRWAKRKKAEKSGD